jgi:hypothetical protein
MALGHNRISVKIRPEILVLATLLGGCDTSITRGYTDAEAFRTRLLTSTPVGSPVDSARSLLVANGFHCSRSTNARFATFPPQVRADYLYCDRETMVMLFVSRRWQIAHVDTGGRVMAVHVTTGVTGP